MQTRSLTRWLFAAVLSVFTSVLCHADSRLVNLSSRVLLGGGQSLTGGLTIGGSGSETVLLRAIGPGLAKFSVSNPLSDPSLTIYNSAGTVVAGPISSWDSSLASTMSGVGAFSLSSGSHDAATVVTLSPGTYTAQVSSAGSNVGTVLLEAYEVSTAGGQLINLSTNSPVSGTNGTVATGFVIGGDVARSVVLRGIGPSLSRFNVSNPLGDPSMSVNDQNGNVLAQNDDWGSPINGGASASDLQTAFNRVGAFWLNAGGADSAVVVALNPGAYTANVNGKSGSGTALTEVYDLTASGDTTVRTVANVGGNNTTAPTPPVVTPPVVAPTPTPMPTPTPAPTTPVVTTSPTAAGDNMADTALQLPKTGNNILYVLTPTVLELEIVNTVPQGTSALSSLNIVNSGVSSTPGAGEFTVTVGGTTVSVSAVNFKRRVLYAPLNTYDLRILNSIFLTLPTPVSDNQSVTVANPDGSLWSSSTVFSASTLAQRYNPAIHVNQEGYVPAFTKKAMIGYYLGDGGELSVSSGTAFKLVDAASGNAVLSGSLSAAPADVGYTTSPLPYQHVMMADFSTFTTPGQYQLEVAGMGASVPFLINEGIAMAWTRTYAMGMYHQRSGMEVKMPYTRFTHAADHTAPSLVPVPDSSAQFSFTWNCIKGYATTTNANNPAQVAPALTSNGTSLYPYVNTGSVDTTGGHFDAGDYSKYTENSAQLVHELIFAVDNVPGVQSFDNLGIPESGDGIPDVLQEAKWEADYLAKIQDADGGFYFLVYPLNREYESNVLPENGDQQVVWPKSTSVSAAAVAALAEAASSPAMKQYYPAQAANYLAKAKLGWTFLMNATSKYGVDGRYQKITFYSDNWTDKDEFAWAASAMYAATGDTTYQTYLQSVFPDPTDTSTFRWGWWRMSEGWGNAIRTYAFAAKNGRLQASQLDAGYLAKCNQTIVAAGDDAANWSQGCAYGTPFPPATKAVLGGGWYFGLDQASDMAIAYLVSPKQAYVDGLVAAMNYEGGTNPVNVCYLQGLGVKRQQQVVSQYAQNSRRVMAPTGFVSGQVTAGYEYLNAYGQSLSNFSYPTDSGTTNTYPYYDRWSDAYNVTTEQITVNLARSLISVGFLASKTSVASTAWTAPAGATISVPSSVANLGTPVTLTVSVPGQDLSNARVVWEARDQQPSFGSTFTITPVNDGDQWVECEVEWPDGRRAFATADFQANSTSQVWIDDALPANAVTKADSDSWTWQSALTHSGSLAFQMQSVSGTHDVSFSGSNGSMDFTQSTVGQQGSMLVKTGDTLSAWVYLDPSSPPTEVMMCWYDGSSYEHRAYWGADSIQWGNNNSASRYNAGALPATGKWVQISVPASAVGLEGMTVTGMTFAAYNGRVTWDTIGRSGSGN